MATLSNGCVRNLTGQPGNLCVQRQDTVRIIAQQSVQPAIKAVCPVDAACTSQFTNALCHFCNSDAKQIELLVMLCKRPVNPY